MATTFFDKMNSRLPKKRMLLNRKKKLFLGVLSFFLLSACGNSEEGGGGWGQPQEFPVFKVTKSDYTGFTTYSTKIEGIQDIEIRAKVDGYIQAIYVGEGDFVKKGQLLMKLEANVFSQNSDASKAAIKSAQASVNSAKIEVERLKPLVETKVISNVQLQMAEAKLQSAQAQLGQANSVFNANVANQNYTSITSPVDGYVGKLNYRDGSLVGPASPQSITTISNTSQIYAYFSVSENEINKLTKGLTGKSLNDKLKQLPKLQLQLVDGSLYPVEGMIDASTGKVSSKTGAILLRAIFDNPDAILLSGNSGVLKIPNYFKDCIAVPEVSTFNMQGMSMVYTVSEGDTLKMRPIQVKGKADKYLIIESGLEVGERVLAQGVGKVYPNSVIIPQEVKIESLINNYNPLFK